MHSLDGTARRVNPSRNRYVSEENYDYFNYDDYEIMMAIINNVHEEIFE